MNRLRSRFRGFNRRADDDIVLSRDSYDDFSKRKFLSRLYTSGIQIPIAKSSTTCLNVQQCAMRGLILFIRAIFTYFGIGAQVTPNLVSWCSAAPNLSSEVFVECYSYVYNKQR